MDDLTFLVEILGFSAEQARHKLQYGCDAEAWQHVYEAAKLNTEFPERYTRALVEKYRHPRQAKIKWYRPIVDAEEDTTEVGSEREQLLARARKLSGRGAWFVTTSGQRAQLWEHGVSISGETKPGAQKSRSQGTILFHGMPVDDLKAILDAAEENKARWETVIVDIGWREFVEQLSQDDSHPFVQEHLKRWRRGVSLEETVSGVMREPGEEG